jgi:hypothetical protein
MTMTRETNFFMAKGNICLYGWFAEHTL